MNWKGITLGLAALLATSCTNELDESSIDSSLREGEIALQWLPANMGIHKVQTKGTDPKTAAEQKIYNAHVFIFQDNGNYLEAKENDAFQGYRYIENGSNLVLQSDMFGEEADKATIYVLANMPRDIFKDSDNNGRPDEITKLSDFDNFVFNLPEFTVTLPATGLPMVGQLSNQDLTSAATEKIILMQLKSLMARIDLNFTMNPRQESEDAQFPSLRIDNVKISSFPNGGAVVPQLDKAGTEETNDMNGKIQLKGKRDNELEVEVDEFTGRIIRKGAPQSLTLYMFEHARPKPSMLWPENIKEEEKQRYKAKLADEIAAYIELEGIYTNHNGYMYKVAYRLYPGANPIDDFTIKANRQYKNNISISGISVNNEGTEALLDTRVTIDTEVNPYFIEMLREREHDAHFNITPMDIFIYEPGTVTVEIVDPEKTPWIRMEPIGRAAEKAGDGKREYFTTDLLEELNEQTNSKSYTVKDGMDADKTYEERIYFYVDENVPGAPYNTEVTNGAPVRAREAKLKVTYEGRDNGVKHTREIPIRQAGLRQAIYFDKYKNGPAKAQPFYFYIEEYEEYLTHYDGKNEYSDTYEGFKWGLPGLNSGLGVTDGNYNQYMRWGWKNTMQIMEQYRTSPGWPGEMTLNDTPSGAAEYCYNKNKRNKEGKVVEARWYLPTISELEYALEKYYGIFNVFQDKWYWSSNPGAAGNQGNDGENPDYARATRIKYDPNDDEATDEGFVHYQSSPDQEGHQLRYKEFRIRAAYIYQPASDAPSVKVNY